VRAWRRLPPDVRQIVVIIIVRFVATLIALHWLGLT
jgi:hypothetical protein